MELQVNKMLIMTRRMLSRNTAQHWTFTLSLLHSFNAATNYNARSLRDHRMSPRLIMAASPLSRVYEYAMFVAEGFLDGAQD